MALVRDRGRRSFSYGVPTSLADKGGRQSRVYKWQNAFLCCSTELPDTHHMHMRGSFLATVFLLNDPGSLSHCNISIRNAAN